MQVQNRPSGAHGYPVRNYAPSYPQHPGTKCAATIKPAAGKSFTIEALLAKPDERITGRTSPTACGMKYQSAAGLHPLAGQMCSPMPQYLYAPNMLHAVMHTQPGYSVYCCPPFTYQASCRGSFYDSAQSKDSVHSFKHKGGKSKRMRTSFTNDQLSRLETEFARQQYMVGSERFLLASALQLTEAQVKVWFQNRRIKWRKQSLEQQQAKLAKLGLGAPPRSPGSQGQEEEGDEEEEIDFSDGSDVDIDGPLDHC